MEKLEISSLDLRFLVKELKKLLEGGYFRKIYQYEIAYEKKKTYAFLFEIFVPGKEKYWLYFDKSKIYLTRYKKPTPIVPPSFCRLLRKHLEGTKIIEIQQHEFDRIIELTTEKNVLILEMFSDGNVILCDSEKRIIAPFYTQTWKDRKVKPKIFYQYPPTKINPFAISFDHFRDFLGRSEKKIIAVLAADFGFGQVYAKEICVRAGVDEKTISSELSAYLHVKLFNTIKEIDNLSIEPRLYENFVSPFPLQNPDVGDVKKRMETFAFALDEFFSEQEIKSAEAFEKKLEERRKEKLERIWKEQEEKIEEWRKKVEENKKRGDLIYTYFNILESAIDNIKSLKDSGISWKELKEAVKVLPNMEMVKEIKEKEGVILVELEGEKIEIDFRKPLTENANMFYEKAKSMKRKILGVEKSKEKIAEKIEKEKEVKEVAKPIKIERKEKQWFEKFRWFKTSDDFLVVGGKDATSNEVLIKKYTESEDIVFHSLMHGSPFVVIKANGREISEAAKKEAAEFTAAYSKAWQMGLGTTDIYCVKPEQISKKAKSGEYLAKGSFMIYGEREWFKNTEVRIAIGVKIDRIQKGANFFSGPLDAVKAKCEYYVILKPGYKKSEELARMIKILLIKKAKEDERPLIGSIPLDDIQRLVPFGTGEIVFDETLFRFENER
jgi:predicted ribosome quality control (RQC) complex YloA/Tae2 family protein